MLTPKGLEIIFQEAITIPSRFETEIQIRGRYIKGNSNKYSYGYYDEIQDEVHGNRIKIIVNEAIRLLLIEKQTYIFTGVVKKVVKNSSIEFHIIIIESPIEQERIVTDKDKRLLSLMERKGEKSIIRPSSVLEDILIRGEKPSIAFVFPLSTETKGEFYDQLGVERASYNTNELSINFGNADVFKKDIENIDNEQYDVIVLLRGGGAGLNFFDNLDIIESILNMNTPVLLGVGHGDTPVLLRQFVNEWKNNPTDTGIYLRELSERITKQRDNSEHVISERLKSQIEAEFNDLQKSNEYIKNDHIALKTNMNNTIKLNNQKISSLYNELKYRESEVDRLKKICIAASILGLIIGLLF